MQIMFIRHGETKGNLERRYVGRTDEPLLAEEVGRLEASPYRTFAPDVVYTSGMLRCRQTAEVLFGAYKTAAETRGNATPYVERDFPVCVYMEKKKAQETDGDGLKKILMRYEGKRTEFGAPVIVHPGLNEMDFGAFEYKNYGELNGNPAYQAWLDSGGTLAFPEGEPGVDFRARCRTAFLECIADAKKRNAGRVAFVVHGGTIMAIMEAFAVPKRGFYDWQVKNGEGFLVELGERGEKRFFLSEKS